MGRTLITGAAGALGQSVAKELAARGHSLALADRREAEAPLAALAKEVSGVALAFDSTDAAAWKGALGTLGPGDEVTGAVLVAGGYRGGAPLHESDDATFHAMMSMNLDTAHQSLRALLPSMVARRQGSIVVIGSRAVERPWTSAGAAAYAASKSAVVALAQAVAAEVLESGVRVNAVLPSTIDTAANRRAMPEADFARWVAPASIASLVAFLLSDDARDVSGASIPIYGRS